MKKSEQYKKLADDLLDVDWDGFPSYTSDEIDCIYNDLIEMSKIAEKEEKPTVKEFVVGKRYRFNLSERPSVFNHDGKMDAILDKEPHICVMAKGQSALFEGQIASSPCGMWLYNSVMEHFELVD